MKDGIIELDTPFAKKIGFVSSKFHGYLWKKENKIIISFIISKEENKGNLSKLFNSILLEGYDVAVPIPSGRMQQILLKRGFKRKIIYDGVLRDSVELYVLESNKNKEN